jgi:hypothetical protein
MMVIPTQRDQAALALEHANGRNALTGMMVIPTHVAPALRNWY